MSSTLKIFADFHNFKRLLSYKFESQNALVQHHIKRNQPDRLQSGFCPFRSDVIGIGFCENDDEVDERADTEKSRCEQIKNTHACLALIELVSAENAEEETEQESRPLVAFLAVTHTAHIVRLRAVIDNDLRLRTLELLDLSAACRTNNCISGYLRRAELAELHSRLDLLLRRLILLCRISVLLLYGLCVLLLTELLRLVILRLCILLRLAILRLCILLRLAGTILGLIVAVFFKIYHGFLLCGVLLK